MHAIQPPGSSACRDLQWDPLGDALAISLANASYVLVWYRRTGRLRTLDIGVRDVSFLRWSRAGHYLALGTTKGTLCIYHRSTHELVWTKIKHKRKITCGDWSSTDRLAYGSEDRFISVAGPDGGMFDQVKVKCRPVYVAFGDGKSAQERSTVSVNMEGRTIMLYSQRDQSGALELAFRPCYGQIIDYEWFGEGYIMAGFSAGYIVVISTKLNEIGREQYCARFHSEELLDLAHCKTTQKLATCGDNGVLKLIDMRDWRSWGADGIRAPDLQELQVHQVEEGGADRISTIKWASDGSLLSAGSTSGALYTYVVRAGVQGDKSSSLYPNHMAERMLRPLSPAAALGAALSLLTLTYFLLTLLLPVSSAWELARLLTSFL